MKIANPEPARVMIHFTTINKHCQRSIKNGKIENQLKFYFKYYRNDGRYYFEKCNKKWRSFPSIIY